MEELWIINSDGLCFFHKSVGEDNKQEEVKKKIQIEEQLFSGLLSGILSFTSEVTSDSIEKIEMKEGKFLFFTKKNLIFIIKSKLNTSDNKIKKKIDQLKELFIEKFEKELDEFDGNISSFQIFEKDLDDTFKKITKTEKWGKGIIDL